MNLSTLKTAFKLIAVIAVTLGVSIATQSLLALNNNWQNPTCVPPLCNADEPINASSSPQGKLGSLNVAASTTMTALGIFGVTGNLAVNASTNDLYVNWLTNKVGIGTNNPQGKLHVVTTSETNPTSVVAWGGKYFVVGMDAAAGGVGIAYNQTTNTGIIQALTPNVTFRNLVLQPNNGANGGNVGIGTTNPQAKLDVNGSLRIVDGNQAQGKVLMSDSTGVAKWVATSTLGISGSGGGSGTWVTLGSIEASGNQPNLTLFFNSAGYKMLKIIYKIGGTDTTPRHSWIRVSTDGVGVDASPNYDYVYVYGNGGGAVSSGGVANTHGKIASVADYNLTTGYLYTIGEATMTNDFGSRKQLTSTYSALHPGVWSEIGVVNTTYRDVGQIKGIQIYNDVGNILVGSSIIVQGMNY